MAYSTIDKSSDYMNTVLYSGNGTTQSITGVGFQPDMVWAKARAGSVNHALVDAVRGATNQLRPNDTNDEYTGGFVSFNADGFSLNNNWNENNNGVNYASWNWLAGTSHSGATTGSGTAKTYTASVNTTSGISITKYVGNGTAGHTIPHNLGVKPAFILFKNLDDDTTNWQGYHKSLGATKTFKLNSTDAQGTSASISNDTEPTTSVFTLGSGGDSNANDQNHIAYCFADVAGYSKFSSYKGNNNADGTFVYTGFKPAFLMIKYTGSGQNWIIVDNKRPGYNLISAADSQNLRPNTSDSEQTSNGIDLLSNGFKCRSSDGDSNGYTTNYIYMAFGQPIISNSGVSATAR